MSERDDSLVRPYAITGGRTGADNHHIRVETQVETTELGIRRRRDYRWEAARVLEMCRRPHALAEIASRLEVPVGVARVLVADLCKDGVLMTDAARPADESYEALLERVLEGLKRL